MTEEKITELYSDILLEHSSHPSHALLMNHYTQEAKGWNPLCGDRIHLRIKLNSAQQIEKISFKAEGCAISIASASILSDLIEKKTISEAKAWIQRFRKAMQGEGVSLEGDLEALRGIHRFPARIKCALLGWMALGDALLKSETEVHKKETPHL